MIISVFFMPKALARASRLSLAVFTVFLRWLFFAFLSAGAESVFLPNIVFLSFSSIARLHPISSLETLQDDEFFFDFFVMIITSQKD